MTSLGADLRYALRTMVGRPLFSATAIITLALAIGGNTTMFTVIRAVLLQPLQYRDADRLLRIEGGATPSRYDELRAGTHTLSDAGAYTGVEDLALSGGAEPEVVKAAHVSANFLRILGTDPLRGRAFREQEDAPGAAPVAMISEELWQRRFSGDPRILGTTATVAATPVTIVGILPARFQFPSPGLDVWLPAPASLTSLSAVSRRLSPFLTLFGRLKPGVTLAQANAEMQVIHRQYAIGHPEMLDAKAKTPSEVVPLKDDLVSGVRSMLWLLFGAVGLVLLIACANVAGLSLARAAARSREMAVRLAIGATRQRLIAQLLAESILLSVAGGTLGIFLAQASLRAIPAMTSFTLPRAAEIRLDWTVFVFTAVLSIGAGILFGLVPSLRASRPDLISVLRASGDAASPGARRGVNLRGAILVGQIALSVVLLIGAALLLQTVAKLRRVDVGFDASNLLTMRVTLPGLRYDSDQKKAAFFRDLMGRVQNTPGVRAAATAWYLPMMGSAGTPVQDGSKPPLKLNERPIATLVIASPGYLSTLGIPLRRGREFTEQDGAESRPVAIIDENLARHLWPAYPAGPDPVGQHLLVGGASAKPVEIVGIAANVHQNLEGNVWQDTVYASFAQRPQLSAMLAIRTTGDPLRFTRAVREQVQAIDREQPVAAVRTMDELVERAVGERRLLAPLLASFGAVALLLAVIGIYGVIAYSVSQRTREMAIRQALGAQRADILRLVIAQGLALTSLGVALGAGGAFALTRVMRTLLFHVSATDPATFIAIAALFLGVAFAASYLPARRSARTDPMTALRF